MSRRPKISTTTNFLKPNKESLKCPRFTAMSGCEDMELEE